MWQKYDLHSANVGPVLRERVWGVLAGDFLVLNIDDKNSEGLDSLVKYLLLQSA